MQKQIVISRYKENMDWTKDIKKNFIIYNKSGLNDLTGNNVIDIPNTVWHPGRVGREAETYLSHIITHWNSLADQTTFIQAFPFDHCEDIIDYLNDDVKTDYRGFKNLIRHTLNDSLRKVWRDVFGDMLLSDHLVSYQGAQFEVSRELVHSRGKQFYIDLYNKTMLNFNITSWGAAYFLETIWIDVFLYKNPDYVDLYKSFLEMRIEHCIKNWHKYIEEEEHVDILLSRIPDKFDKFKNIEPEITKE